MRALYDNPTCLINYCSPEWIEIIRQHSITHSYPKGQFVFMEGSLVMGAYFILKGKVKVISSDQTGKEQTVRLANEEHMLGHTAIGLEKYSVGAITLEDSIICFIENKILYEAFMANPKFTFEVMLFYSRELRKSELRTKCLALMNNEEKVILGLLYIADTYQQDIIKNQIEIKLSRLEIAQIIGTNAEQVSRVLSNLKRDFLIEIIERKIIIKNINLLRSKLNNYPFATGY